MTKPTIHWNGTGRSTLLDDYVGAIQAVREAMETVAKAGPNARDYYVQPVGAFENAQTEHRARLLKLREVMRELEELAEHVCDAPGQGKAL